MAYESLYDPTNPFNRDGLSKEVRALLDYLEAAKRHTDVDVVVTSTTDHPVTGTTYHLRDGTDGKGLALDCRLRTRGFDTHRSVFDLFRPVERQLAELIYADPPSGPRTDGRVGPYNIKDGRRVPPYAVSTHHDHVHVAVRLGTFLRYPEPPEDELTDAEKAQLATAAQKSTDAVNYAVDAQKRIVALTATVEALSSEVRAIADKLGLP